MRAKLRFSSDEQRQALVDFALAINREVGVRLRKFTPNSSDEKRWAEEGVVIPWNLESITGKRGI